jgi:Transposase, Mutator family/Domain of unknown function (DUF4865)
MIAMQYSFELPADYDMTIIERRVAISGFDSKAWQRVRFWSWPDEISASDPHTTDYNVLRTSAPQGKEPFIQ